MVSIDLRTGERVWSQEIGGVQMPWVAGAFVYVLTTENDLVCLSRREGRIRWVRRLRRFKDPEDRRGPISWFGPVLAGDRLILVSSDAKAVSISPYTGEILGTIKLSDPASVAPVVAEETLYILTDDARIVAWR
jgi:outer membrane protein assembly factor BamB